MENLQKEEEEGEMMKKKKKKEEKLVCVTGGSGFIGSWVVRLLLQRGYSVRATVQNLQNEQETKHLKSLEGANSTNLTLHQIDLLDYHSILDAINGAAGVFHLASPCILDRVHDPQQELLEPAIRGTQNVLKAAKECGVKRVVVTSSVSSITPSPRWPKDVVKDENCWTDEDYCTLNGLWYPLSKTLAEKEVWKLAEETGLNVACINPGLVMGPILPPTLNASMALLLQLLQGSKMEDYVDLYMGSVHVKDVALGHILLYENPSASGRHLCVEAITHFSDFAQTVSRLYPQYNIHRFTEETNPGLLRVSDPSKKLISLGIHFSSMEEIIKDAVASLREKGFIN